MRSFRRVWARLGFPGRYFSRLETKPYLSSVLRTSVAKQVDKVVVAIPDGAGDDVLKKFCEQKNIAYYRGDEQDVLDRYYQTAKHFGATTIVRITSDCPLIDPKIVDQTIEAYRKHNCDYLSTGRLVTTFPDGLDTEVVSFSVLERAWKEAKLPSEREHVTPYIWNHPELFSVATYDYDRDLSALRWTVDEPRDLEFARRVFQELGGEGKMFYMVDILTLLEKHPEIGAINSDIERNSGYYKSLRAEA